MRRFPLALILIALCTAGIRAGSPPVVTNQHTRIAFIFSVHHPLASQWSDSALQRIYQQQPDAIVMVDDVLATQFGGYETQDSLVLMYQTAIRRRSKIPVYGGIDNWCLATAGVGDIAESFTVTAVDSADPLRYARRAIPMMDWYGNYYVDIGNTRVFFLNSNFTNATDSCESQRRRWDPKTGHGTGFYGSGNQDRAYMPASMYSNWNSVTGPGYLHFKAAVQSCTLPHFILVAPKGFYPVQGDTSASGVWCWNRATVFKALLRLDSHWCGPQDRRGALRAPALLLQHHGRGDSAITYANGGVDYLNGPPCGASHAPTIGAQLYTGNISPDTCAAESIDLWQNHGGVNGELLQTSNSTPTEANESAKFSRILKRPAWRLYDASFTSHTWTTYDSSGVKHQVTRAVR